MLKVGISMNRPPTLKTQLSLDDFSLKITRWLCDLGSLSLARYHLVPRGLIECIMGTSPQLVLRVNPAVVMAAIIKTPQCCQVCPVSDQLDIRPLRHSLKAAPTESLRASNGFSLIVWASLGVDASKLRVMARASCHLGRVNTRRNLCHFAPKCCTLSNLWIYGVVSAWLQLSK